MVEARRATAGKAAARIGTTVRHELRQLLPPTIFFFIGFNLILLTKRLILEDYLIQFSGFMVATMGALIVGKVVLVADQVRLLRRLDDAPLIRPILFKTVVYTLLVGVARLLEGLVHYLVEGGVVGGGGFVHQLVGRFSWHHFVATQLWILVLFLAYVTVSELHRVLGRGWLLGILFARRRSASGGESSDALSRRPHEGKPV
jgi:hypothetical protein